MHFKVGSGDFVHSEGRLVFHSLPGQEVGRKKEKKERAISGVFSAPCLGFSIFNSLCICAFYLDFQTF